MSTAAASWPAQAESWLDERGKGAWIVAMVLGFIFFWPVGLALLFYMIWSKRMSNGCAPRKRHFHRHKFSDSGNSAFDSYKADVLSRLEQEQDDFKDFLKRLRESKDKMEFDDFMSEREKRNKADIDGEAEPA